MEQSPQPYFFKRPSRLLSLWVLILVLMVGYLAVQVLRSDLLGTVLSPLT